MNSTAIMDTSQSDAIGSYHSIESIYEERNSCNEPRHPTARISEEVAAFKEDSGSYTPTHSECEDRSPDWSQLPESNRAEERRTTQEWRTVRNSNPRRVDSCWTAHHIKVNTRLQAVTEQLRMKCHQRTVVISLMEILSKR